MMTTVIITPLLFFTRTVLTKTYLQSPSKKKKGWQPKLRTYNQLHLNKKLFFHSCRGINWRRRGRREVSSNTASIFFAKYTRWWVTALLCTRHFLFTCHLASVLKRNLLEGYDLWFPRNCAKNISWIVTNMVKTLISKK